MSETRRIVHNPEGKPEGWYVVSEDGSHFFNDKPYKSKAEAEKLLEAVEANKHKHSAAPEMERRVLTATLEVRAAREKSSSPGTLHGYAARFNEPSGDLGGFREILAPGAFRAVLGHDVRALRNHEPDLILGRLSAGTLRLEEDGDGLRYEVDLPDTTHGRDTAEMVRRGDLTGSSFGFRVAPQGDQWSMGDGGMPMRTVHKIMSLHDVGPVTFPAYESTRVDVRSLEYARDIIAHCTEAEVSLSLAKARAALAGLKLP